MTRDINVDHPAVGAAQVFLAGSADALVGAALLTDRVPYATWVMIAREHRLPVLLERPVAETAREIWCLGYAGTGDDLLPAALQAHVSHRPVHWLSTTTGRLSLAAQEVPGLCFESMPGGSLVLLVQRHLQGSWEPDDYLYERLGLLLGRSPGVRPSDPELALVNTLHGAAVAVRNNEHLGAGLVRSLAKTSPSCWQQDATLQTLCNEGDRLIRAGRTLLMERMPSRGGRFGPALWVVETGSIARGVHGKAIATQSYNRQAPAALVERVEAGFTKAWVVLPRQDARLWHHISTTFGQFGKDFSYTGLRGAGALPGQAVDELIELLWDDLNGASADKPSNY